MWSLKIIGLAFFLKTVFCTCYTDTRLHDFNKEVPRHKIRRTGRLGDAVPESSGLETAGKHLWTINDSGNKPWLFKVSNQGKVLDTLHIPGLVNKDWEELAKDRDGNLYIGDFGNNLNKRKDLRIFKVHAPISDSSAVDTIAFNYPDQKAFPPDDKRMNFDCEGMFWHQDHLYLFSKNRGKKCVKMYRLPDHSGNWEAGLLQEIYLKGAITAADISPDHKTIALLSYGRIYYFSAGHKQPLRLDQPLRCRRFGRARQSEALVYTGEKQFCLSNEQQRLFHAKP